MLYRGPYRVLRRSEKFFVLQIGDKSDSVTACLLHCSCRSSYSPFLRVSSVSSSSCPCSSGSCTSSEEESFFLSSSPGSSHSAPLESLPDGLRFFASLRRPLASPSGGNSCGDYNDLSAASLL